MTKRKTSTPTAKAKSKAKAAPMPSAACCDTDDCDCDCDCAGVDLETVRELAEIANQFDLAEVEVDICGGIRVVRRVAAAAVAAPMASLPMAAHVVSAPVAVEKAEKVVEAGTMITSPFVGTFYRAPSPEASAFTDVGQNVRKGQVVCIVEAMKLMNEIESELDGKVLEILVKNAEHVEYGQPLFRIEKA